MSSGPGPTLDSFVDPHAQDAGEPLVMVMVMVLGPGNAGQTP